MAPEVWLLIWICVTTTNPGCMKWDGATEKVTLFKSEAECVSYATKIVHKVHTSFHFDLEYICRKGVPPEPFTPNSRPQFQTETLLLNEDGNVRRFNERNMKWLITSVAVLVVSSGLTHSVLAKSRDGQCTGILHQDKTGLKFGGGDEGICIIKKDDESRILSACTVGRYCMVKGQVDPCKDSGE